MGIAPILQERYFRFSSAGAIASSVGAASAQQALLRQHLQSRVLRLVHQLFLHRHKQQQERQVLPT